MAGNRKTAVRMAPEGSTGNNTHATTQFGGDFTTLVGIFEITAVGATPTVTFKFQGAFDLGPEIGPGTPQVPTADLTPATNWFDMGYVTVASDTYATAGVVVTAVGRTFLFFKRPAEFIRLVTSANTNVTYRAFVVPLIEP